MPAPRPRSLPLVILSEAAGRVEGTLSVKACGQKKQSVSTNAVQRSFDSLRSLRMTKGVSDNREKIWYTDIY